MDWVYIRQVHDYVEKEVELRGWLYNSSKKGKLVFMQVRDGTGIIQCVVFKKEVSEKVFELAPRITQESSVVVRGVVREDPRSPLGYELGVTDLELVHEAGDYPITPKERNIYITVEYSRAFFTCRSGRHGGLRNAIDVLLSGYTPTSLFPCLTLFPPLQQLHKPAVLLPPALHLALRLQLVQMALEDLGAGEEGDPGTLEHPSQELWKGNGRC